MCQPKKEELICPIYDYVKGRFCEFADCPYCNKARSSGDNKKKQ